MSLTLTVLIPAFNEEVGISDTIGSILMQSVPVERILVVDDGSTDGTAAIARAMGVDVVQPPQNLGSKAKAQNYGLEFVDTDLVLPVDADTILDLDYVEKLKEVFSDDGVAVASGVVLTKYQNTIWEKARQIEYLHGFHWYRPIQQKANSVTVCSGCNSVFRTSLLKEFGGFPERTLVEDLDYAWSQQIAGYRAVYVGTTCARAAEPVDRKYLSKQLKRWKYGWMQNLRLHYWELVKHKPMVALWVSLQFLEILLAPIVLSFPFVLVANGMSIWNAILFFLLGEAITVWPPVIYGCYRRKYPIWKAITSYHAWWALKAYNFRWDVQAFWVEIVMVPLGLRKSFLTYEKGRA
jgi:cellulose synthase/poly-beta-1,6-N-acetylglucosamine synthase-like glycosyltransferase